MKCGLIGEKLGHSFSKEIHQKLGDYEYDLIELAPDELEGFILSGDFDGLNVTIPYKQAVMGYLDEISDLAREAGAVMQPAGQRRFLKWMQLNSAALMLLPLNARCTEIPTRQRSACTSKAGTYLSLK